MSATIEQAMTKRLREKNVIRFDQEVTSFWDDTFVQNRGGCDTCGDAYKVVVEVIYHIDEHSGNPDHWQSHMDEFDSFGDLVRELWHYSD